MPALHRPTARAAVEARFPGTRVIAFGHLGDGNIHFNVRAPAGAGADWIEGEGAAVTGFVHDLVTAAGGSISAEHGIGQMKRAELARLGGAARLGALRAIKQALDPKSIMNPGKLVPSRRELRTGLRNAARLNRRAATFRGRFRRAAQNPHGDTSWRPSRRPICRSSTRISSRFRPACTRSYRTRAAETGAYFARPARHPAHRRRVRPCRPHLPDRLLGRRQSGAVGAGRAQRGRERLSRRGGQGAGAVLHPGLHPPLSVHARPNHARTRRSCRSASIRPAIWSASSTRACRCSTARRRPRTSTTS